MAKHDVTTKAKNGQWVNEVDGDPALSRSFRSRDEAVQAGREFTAERGTRHTVVHDEPTGAITDGGDPEDETPVVGEGA